MLRFGVAEGLSGKVLTERAIDAPFLRSNILFFEAYWLQCFWPVEWVRFTLFFFRIWVSLFLGECRKRKHVYHLG